jgi:large subunit ribosomal protein L15
MQSHNLKRTHKNKKARQIGRAGQRGKTSGRGTKGQNARAGHKKRPEIRDFIKRVPKLRGRGKNLNTSIQTKSLIVNLINLEKSFKDGDIINRETLINSGLIKKNSGALSKIKILGTGNVTKKLTIKGCLVSATAKSAIEKAGGAIM